jgi:glucose-1-phosphate thymidylyltransferase
MKAIVLAAGFATRMYPLTRDRAKPLLEVGGRPVIEWLLQRLVALPEVDEVVVVANGRFHADFDAWAARLDVRVPVRVLNDGAQDDDSKLGAIGDLALAVDALEERAAPLLVAAGDNLIGFDLAPYAARFAARPERPLLLVREIEGDIPPRRYNEVVLDGEGGISSFREKPDDPQSPLASICLYFLPGDVRADLATYLEEEANHDAPGYLMQWLHGRRPLAAAALGEGWYDIGNLETLERARRAYAERA